MDEFLRNTQTVEVLNKVEKLVDDTNKRVLRMNPVYPTDVAVLCKALKFLNVIWVTAEDPELNKPKRKGDILLARLEARRAFREALEAQVGHHERLMFATSSEQNGASWNRIT